MINSIEIICIPCPKCNNVENIIRDIIRIMEIKNKIKIIYEFKHTVSLQKMSDYALNPSQTPAILINGKVEWSGLVNRELLTKKLESA